MNLVSKTVTPYYINSLCTMGRLPYFNRSANYVRVLVFGQLLGLGIKSRLVITRALFIIEKSFMYWAVLGTVMDLHLLSY